MVEQAMFFALGFLTAGFIAILLAPALNQRAERLAERRMRALFPVSLEEVAAERDHLRAEFAVSARNMERRQQQLLEEKAAALSEAGKQLSFVNALKRQLEETREKLQRLQAEHADLQTTLETTQSALAAMTADRDRTMEELKKQDGRRAAAEQALALARGRMDEQRLAIVELEERLAAMEQAKAEAAARNDALVARLEAERAAARTLEAAVAEHRANATRMSDRIAALEKRNEQLLETRREADRLAAELRAARERLGRVQEENGQLRLRLAALQAAQPAEAAGAEPQPQRARAERARSGAARARRKTGDDPSRRIDALAQRLLEPDAADTAELASLRREIVDLADALLSAPPAAGPDGADAPEQQAPKPRRARRARGA
ncbi:hypothetical protein ACFFJB_02610 [Camelimonas abortus]|uniref:Uncharacterized protein n=1 Tax=Camelimonas abortus TaxID=1017184 RepID=A0ABV7LDY1_9HYPH